MRIERSEPITVGFVALGCPKNTVDSERMLAEIAQAGFLISTEPEDADVVVINTCGFIAPAKAEALEAIRHAVACKRTGNVEKVIVTGCLPQRMGEDLLLEVEGIDAIAALGERDAIARIISKTINSDAPAAYLGRPNNASGTQTITAPSQAPTVHDDRTRLRITPRHWAYLRISEGCDHQCSFCTIPAIRGPFRSKPQDLVLAEAAELVSAGAVELNLIGQDTTRYGRDLKIKHALPRLLKELEQVSGLAWIRLMYAYPPGVNERLMKTMADSGKIVHYLDVPIQHISTEILKKMRRPDTREDICRLVESVRRAMPDIVLRTTVIVGFPGETDTQFEQLLEFLEWAQFDALGCFKFYPESGTPAAEMPDHVPEAIKDRRVERLMLTQQGIAFAANQRRVGGRLACLVDSIDSGGGARARFYGQAPDIDSLCILPRCSAIPGRFINTVVTGTKDYDLIVEQV